MHRGVETIVIARSVATKQSRKVLGDCFALLAMTAFTLLAGCNGQSAKIEKLAADQPIRAEARVDKAVAAVGDKVMFTLQAIARKNVEVTLAVELPPQTGLDIKDAPSSEPKKIGSDQILYRREWALSPEKTGAYIFPALEVTYKASGDAQAKTMKTPSVYLDVRTVLKEGDLQGDIKDIKGPAELPELFWFWLAVAGGIVALVIGGFLGYRYWKNRKPAIPPLLPHEWALAELQSLLDSGWLEAGKFKEFAERLSGIFRSYVEKRFAVMAPERTTEEFIKEMHGRKEFSPEQHALLGKFLAFCDMIKFAKYAASPAEMSQGVVIVRNFVEETKPKPELAPEQTVSEVAR